MPLVTPSRQTDGTVRIDTKMDTSGVNTGVKKISRSTNSALNDVLFSALKIGNAFNKVTSSISDRFKKMTKSITSMLHHVFMAVFFSLLFSALFSLMRLISDSVTNTLNALTGDVKTQVDAMKNQWEEVKVSITAAFLPLLIFAIPYIKMAMDWLIRLANTIAQITAALLGQKQVWQVVPGSAATLAKQLDKSKKAAQGVLAAFDQLNVLQEKQAETPEAATSTVALQQVPISEETVGIVDKIKDRIQSLRNRWDEFVAGWNKFWSSPLGLTIQKLFDNFKKLLSDMWQNAVTAFENVKAGIIRILTGIQEFVRGVYTKDWSLIWKGLGDIFGGIWDIIKALAVATFQNIILQIRFFVSSARLLLQPLLDFMKAFWDLLKTTASNALESLKAKWISVWAGIKDFVKTTINAIITEINSMINAIVLGINGIIRALNAIQFFIPSWIPDFGGQSFGLHIPFVSAPQIPRLAQGAVIPPNAQFLAVLGDQKSGTNIETPEALLRQIVQEELSATTQTINLVTTLDGEVIARNQARRAFRQGKSLIASGSVA